MTPITSSSRGTTTQLAAPPTRGVVSPASVLITEQEVMLGTTAAAGPPVTGRGSWISALARMFVGSQDERRPARRDCPRRYDFLESVLMSREMDRL